MRVDPDAFNQALNRWERVWCSSALNDYVRFPHVGQVFCIERESIEKKSREIRSEAVFGISSRPPEDAPPEHILELNRHHWRIESTHYMIDWNYDEDRSRIRKGHGPANITRLRRFALGILKSIARPPADYRRTLACSYPAPSSRLRSAADDPQLQSPSVKGGGVRTDLPFQYEAYGAHLSPTGC